MLQDVDSNMSTILRFFLCSEAQILALGGKKWCKRHQNSTDLRFTHIKMEHFWSFFCKCWVMADIFFMQNAFSNAFRSLFTHIWTLQLLFLDTPKIGFSPTRLHKWRPKHVVNTFKHAPWENVSCNVLLVDVASVVRELLQKNDMPIYRLLRFLKG